MAPRNKRARGRSRKRRHATAGVAGAAPGAPAHAQGGSQAASESPGAPPRSAAGTKRGSGQSPGSTSGARRERSRRARSPRRSGGGLDDLLPLGKRPPAPWHPLPLSELLILVGAVGAVVGLTRGISHGAAPLIAGLLAVAIGTVEVTLREHLSGYRSHTIILAVLPVIVLDSAVVLLVAPFGTGLRLGMLVVDVAVFALLYKLLRARFLDARRERVFTGGR